MALSTVRKAFTAKPSYASDPNAAMLMEMCRKATAKDSFQPDANMKQMITAGINESRPGVQVPVPITFDILRRRLNMENPHKQWLAVDLVRHVLGTCPERLRPFRGDLIREVARVADKPNKKGPLAAQQNARKSALEFLQSCGQEGHQALTLVQSMQRGVPATRNRPMHGMDYNSPYYTTPNAGAGAQAAPGSATDAQGPGSPALAAAKPRQQVANMPQQTGDTIADVKQLIETSDSHSALLRELLFIPPEKGGTGKVREGAAADPLVSEVKAEILQVKEMFPQLMDKLSQDKSPDSEALMARAIASFEELNSCLEMAMQAEIVSPVGSPKAADAAEGGAAAAGTGASSSVGEGEAAERAADAAGASTSQADGAAEGEADAKAEPAQAPPVDLLAFDSGPLAPADGEPAAGANPPEAQDPFGGAGGVTAGDSDPFTGGPGGAAAAGGPPPAPVQPQNGAANPFDTAPGTAAPAAGPSGASAGGASLPGPSGRPSNAADSAASNPFGGNAFGSGAPPPLQMPGQPSQPGAPSPGGPSPYGMSGQLQQFPSPQGPPNGYGAPMTGYGPPPPGYGQPYGGAPPGHYGGGPTGPYGGGHTGQFGGYGAPPTGYGAPSPQGNALYGIYGAPTNVGSSWHGPPPQQQQQLAHMSGASNPFGGPPTGGAPYPGQGPNPFGGGPPPGHGYSTSATSMPAPGYGGAAANPFATSATGPGGGPSWNPNVNRDTFNDLLVEHNKRANPTAPMAAPMRSKPDQPATGP